MDNIRAERGGDWKLNLHCMSSFALLSETADKVNYTCWSPDYSMYMLSIPEFRTAAFQNREFAVRYIKGSFNAFWLDMAIESHVKKTKDSGPVGVKKKGTRNELSHI